MAAKMMAIHKRWHTRTYTCRPDTCRLSLLPLFPPAPLHSTPFHSTPFLDLRSLICSFAPLLIRPPNEKAYVKVNDSRGSDADWWRRRRQEGMDLAWLRVGVREFQLLILALGHSHSYSYSQSFVFHYPCLA